MRIKTTSDIKTSIRGFRGRHIVCRTHQMEEDVIRDVTEEFGEICVHDREIYQIKDREKKLAIRAKKARKSLLKTFQQREKARMIQNLVESRNSRSPDTNPAPHQGRTRSSVSANNMSGSGESTQEVVFNEIELEY